MQNKNNTLVSLTLIHVLPGEKGLKVTLNVNIRLWSWKCINNILAVKRVFNQVILILLLLHAELSLMPSIKIMSRGLLFRLGI